MLFNESILKLAIVCQTIVPKGQFHKLFLPIVSLSPLFEFLRHYKDSQKLDIECAWLSLGPEPVYEISFWSTTISCQIASALLPVK